MPARSSRGAPADTRYSSTVPGNSRVSTIGEMPLQVTPYLPRSRATVRVSPTMPSDAAA